MNQDDPDNIKIQKQGNGNPEGINPPDTPSSKTETHVQASEMGSVNITKDGDIIFNTTIFKTDKKPSKTGEKLLFKAENKLLLSEEDKFSSKIEEETGKDERPAKDEVSKVFIDPTKPLPKNPSNLTVFHSSKEIEEKTARWKEERFILISCWSEEVSYSTAFRMIKTPQLEGYEERFLDIKRYGSNGSDLNLEMFLDHRIGSGEKLVVLIDIEAQCPFFDSIFVRKLTAQSIKEELKQKNIFLMGLLNPQLMKQAKEEKKEDFAFASWEIDFLPHLLKNYFPDRAEALARDILQQREKGLWGEIDDDGEFYGNLKKELDLGKEIFAEKVRKRREFDESQKNLDEFMGNIKEVKAKDIFVDEEPLKTLLYTGVFFPRLPVNDFILVASELLKGKTMVREKCTQVVTENGEAKTITEQEEKMALEIWDRESDKLLRRCHLKAVEAGHEPQYIDFVYPYLGNDLEVLIKESYPIYLRQQFQAIQYSGMFFSPNVSESITQYIIRLTVRMAVLHPDYYGFDWLNEFIFQVKVQFNLQFEPTDNPHIAVLQFLRNDANKKIRRHFYSQVSRLIREMLNHQQLKEVVKNFLDHLFTIEGHDAVLHIALNVGKRLLFATRIDFDLFYWLKRVLDQAPEDIKDEAYSLLHQLAIDRKFHIYEILETLRNWVPDRKKGLDTFSPSNRYALIFIVHYCSGTLYQFKKKFAGCWPSRYPLFFPFKKDKSSRREHLGNIVEWLLHPKLEAAFKEYLKKNSRDHETVYFDIHDYLTVIMVEWSVVLLGPGNQKADPEANEILDILLRQIALKTNTQKKRQRELLNWLAERRIYYRDQIAQSGSKNIRERKEMKNKYNIARMLFSRFKEFMAKKKQEEKHETGSTS